MLASVGIRKSNVGGQRYTRGDWSLSEVIHQRLQSCSSPVVSRRPTYQAETPIPYYVIYLEPKIQSVSIGSANGQILPLKHESVLDLGRIIPDVRCPGVLPYLRNYSFVPGIK